MLLIRLIALEMTQLMTLSTLITNPAVITARRLAASSKPPKSFPRPMHMWVILYICQESLPLMIPRRIE